MREGEGEGERGRERKTLQIVWEKGERKQNDCLSQNLDLVTFKALTCLD